MRHPFRKTTVVTATVALACFGAGYAFTGGAYTFESHRAAGQAVAAARDVDTKRQELEASLERAQTLSDDAGVVSTDARVRNAARTLSLVTSDALVVAAQNDVVVSARPVDANSAPLMRAATILPAPHVPDEPADTVTVDADLHDVVGDEDVAKVLSGEVTDLSATRDATTKLAEVGDALDASRAKVEASAETVKDATQDAYLDREAETLDTTVDQVPELSDDATSILAAIQLNVIDTTTISNVNAATVALDESAASAGTIDREDQAAVSTAFAAVTAISTALNRALDAAKASHLAWVDAENARRAELNEQGQGDYELELERARAEYTAQNLEYVSARSNGWVGTPTEVSGSNGRLASGSLCPVSFAPGQLLQCNAAASLEQADDSYFAQTGRHLVMTDSYRSYSLQVTTRAKKPGTAAVPGTSNHGWGMAVDLDAASAAWLTSNGPNFGWVHPAWARPGGPKPEFWHLEYVAPEMGGFTAPDAPAPLEPVASALAHD